MYIVQQQNIYRINQAVAFPVLLSSLQRSFTSFSCHNVTLYFKSLMSEWELLLTRTFSPDSLSSAYHVHPYMACHMENYA